MARRLYGHMRDGGAVHGHTLGAGDLTATILDMGGTITAIELAGRNIVLGLKDLAAYEASGRWNCLIGRYANRLQNGAAVAGRHYPLVQDADGITLHGGRGHSWGARLWQTVQADDAAVTLQLASPDGDQGFPGSVTAQVRFSVTPDALRLDYSAVTDAPTVINLTNHLYFNLAGTGLVTNQLLQLNADAYTPTDARQIPTGEIAQVTGTSFDFRQATAIGTRVDTAESQMVLVGGLDHNFVLNKSAPGALEWAARLMDSNRSLMLEVATTQPGIQVYSTNNVKPGTFNTTGTEIQKRGGLALETQHFPDSPNRPNFPSTMLMPGETFRASTLFRVLRP